MVAILVAKCREENSNNPHPEGGILRVCKRLDHIGRIAESGSKPPMAWKHSPLSSDNHSKEAQPSKDKYELTHRLETLFGDRQSLFLKQIRFFRP